MHLLLLVAVTAGAWVWRDRWTPGPGTWAQRWRHALTGMLVPPAAVLSTAIAVALMGADGEMFGCTVGRAGTVAAVLVAAWALGCGVRQGVGTWRLQRRIARCPQVEIDGYPARWLDLDAPFAAAIAADIAVSRGLIETLPPEQVAAILAHERAHLACRDPQWFALLGWLRQLGAWLPQTRALWEELLCLRELRADRRAVQTVEPLLLAETLLHLARQPASAAELCGAIDPSASRLVQRIEALLAPEAIDVTPPAPSLAIWLPPVLPLLLVLFHG